MKGKMKYLIVTIFLLATAFTINPKYVQTKQPPAVLVNHISEFHVERFGEWLDGTIELRVPNNVTGFTAALLNDNGPCHTYLGLDIHVVCWPESSYAHLVGVGRVGPHRSPMPVVGIAQDKLNKEESIAFLVIGGQSYSFLPLLIR